MNFVNISNEEKSNQIKSKVYIENLKSDFFVIKMFDIMKRKKSLEIMKYNKKLQKRLNLGINDYKDFCQLYSSIEIELKVINNVDGKFNKFINLPENEKEKEYYHIFFDNSKEEIKRNYLKENEKVETIKIIINHPVNSFRGLICLLLFYLFNIF